MTNDVNNDVQADFNQDEFNEEAYRMLMRCSALNNKLDEKYDREGLPKDSPLRKGYSQEWNKWRNFWGTQRIKFNCNRLINLNLKDAKLYCCDIEDIDLIRVILSGADFFDSQFKNVKILLCNSSNGNFENSKFKNCHIDSVNFENSKFESVELEKIWMDRADFTNTNLNFIKCVESNFACCKLFKSDFYESDLRGLNLINCKVDNTTDFTDCRVGVDTDFSG